MGVHRAPAGTGTRDVGPPGPGRVARYGGGPPAFSVRRGFPPTRPPLSLARLWQGLGWGGFDAWPTGRVAGWWRAPCFAGPLTAPPPLVRARFAGLLAVGGDRRWGSGLLPCRAGRRRHRCGTRTALTALPRTGVPPAVAPRWARNPKGGAVGGPAEQGARHHQPTTREPPLTSRVVPAPGWRAPPTLPSRPAPQQPCARNGKTTQHPPGEPGVEAAPPRSPTHPRQRHTRRPARQRKGRVGGRKKPQPEATSPRRNTPPSPS